MSNFSWNGHARLHEAILYIAVAYILLCKLYYGLTLTRHAFINIFQMEHFLAVKFVMVWEKYELAKSPKVWKKKVEKTGLGSIKTILNCKWLNDTFWKKG